MRLIVTRVQPQADQWVQALRERGLQALALPLIETTAVADLLPLRQAWLCWPAYHAVMFVSAHAVHHFFKEKEALALSGIALADTKTRAWTTGPGSTAALQAQGFSAALTDAPASHSAQFDSEALWQRVQHQVAAGQRVLIVRGDTAGSDDGAAKGVGRDWLAQRLQSVGVRVDYVVAYRRAAPQWDTLQRKLAERAVSDGSVWIFSSAEAVGNLAHLLPGTDWSATRSVATHERIGQAAQALGFARVAVSSPTLAQVLASIESLA